MRLRQIEVFFLVYREGSISGAARALHVSQPSVSKSLKYAEDQIGFPLFIREKGRIQPTQAAHELYADVKEIFRLVDAFNRTSKNISKRKGGHLRVGSLPSLSLEVLPECIENLRAKSPNLSFELTTLHSSEINDAILEKRCDICFCFETEHDDRLRIDHFSDAPLLMIADSTFPVPDGLKIDISSLQDFNFIGLKDSGPVARILLDAFEELDTKPTEVVTAHTYYVALSLVRRGLGISVTDSFTAASMLGNGLKTYGFTNPLTHPVCAVSLHDNEQAVLIEECVSAARDTILAHLAG